jgi:hypothetical protein
MDPILHLLIALYAVLWLQAVFLLFSGTKSLRLAMGGPSVLLPISAYYFYINEQTISLVVGGAAFSLYMVSFNWKNVIQTAVGKTALDDIYNRITAIMLVSGLLTTALGLMLIYIV